MTRSVGQLERGRADQQAAAKDAKRHRIVGRLQRFVRGFELEARSRRRPCHHPANDPSEVSPAS